MDELKQSIQARRELLAAWRAGQRHELTLPSGLVVTVRDATVMDLVVNGNIPQSLLSLIMAQTQQNNAVDLSKLDGTAEFGKLVNELVLICVIEPPVADKADDEHIGLDELPGGDKMAIFNWANREVGQAATFREGTLQPVDAA